MHYTYNRYVYYCIYDYAKKFLIIAVIVTFGKKAICTKNNQNEIDTSSNNIINNNWDITNNNVIDNIFRQIFIKYYNKNIILKIFTVMQNNGLQDHREQIAKCLIDLAHQSNYQIM